jgi:branched-chain amino acid transport system substrate-binding protein
MRFLKVVLSLGALIFTFVLATGVMAKDIVIGYSAPLSGPAAEYGQDCANGVDMAIKEINAAGGITVKGQNYTFKFEKLDDRVDPTQAVNNARRFREQSKAVAVFNPVTVTINAIAKINEEKGNEFLLMAHSNSPKTGKLGNKLIFIYPPFTIYSRIFTDKAWQMGWRKIGMLVTLGAYGDEWRQVFKLDWEKKGGKITADAPANYYKDTDFSSPLTTVLATKPDALFIGGPTPSTALVVEQARNMGFKGGFILIDQAKVDGIASILKGTKMMENVICVAAVADLPAPEAKRFDAKYRAKYKRMDNWDSVLNYNCMMALSRAIVAAETVTDVKAIRAAFPKAFPMLSDKFPSEIMGVSNEGVFYLPLSLQTVRNGKFTQAVVYDWWSKTQAEYNRTKRLTKFTVPVLWAKYAD